jgi:hypothetical protein
MSEFTKKLLAGAREKYGPPPESYSFGDTIDWSSSLMETFLYVELPFWLMVPAGSITVCVSGTDFQVEVCGPWMEVFGKEITDSRVSCFHQGPRREDYEPPSTVITALDQLKLTWMKRNCKTVLRIKACAHNDAFRSIREDERPAVQGEREAYWASLCEAHLPVINEVIQRYRLVTYDYFAYEVSAWDVPVWNVKHGNEGFRALLLPYKGWDDKPVTIEDGDSPGDPPKLRQFEWASLAEISDASSDNATPGEFDLLDARSLMERGDYTGAVRRTVTAIEAVLGWALLGELEKQHAEAEAAAKLANTDNDFPGRLAQWRKLAKPPITQGEFDRFEETRKIRHEIVHRGRRLAHNDRGRAQRAVDTGRWLYNKIEAKPGRAKLRDRGVLKSAGRVAMAPRFSSTVTPHGIVLEPL